MSIGQKRRSTLTNSRGDGQGTEDPEAAEERAEIMAKLPQNLLRPPDAYIDEQIKKAFTQTGFSGVPLWTESGCTLFVHAPERMIEEAQGGIPALGLQFEEVDGVPLIWFDLQLRASHGEQPNLYVFLNILDDQDVNCLQALPYQRWIVIHWYDESRKYCGSSAVEWTPENQKEVGTVAGQARALIEQTGGGDFEAAINRVRNNATRSD